MAKIKGWKKYTEYNFEISWVNLVNKKRPVQLFVEKPSGVEEWSVYTNIGIERDDFKDFGTFKTKEQALNFATKYMRSHPNG